MRISCASVRLAESLQRNVYPNARRWRISIEDPFELNHDLGSPVSKSGQVAIQEELNRAVKLLDQGVPIDDLLAPADNDNYLPEAVSDRRKRQERATQKRSPNNRTKKEKKELRSKSKFQNAGPSVDKNSVSNLAPNRKAIPGMGIQCLQKRATDGRNRKQIQIYILVYYSFMIVFYKLKYFFIRLLK